MMEGWVSIHRKIQECWIWMDEPFSRGQAWVDLLLLANHQDKKTYVDGKLVTIKTGQRLTSIRQLAERWQWSRDKVSRFLSILEGDNMITVQKSHRFTLIEVTNYEEYQGFTKPKKATKKPLKSHSSDSIEPLIDTNNNDNNDNNDNKRKRFVPPTVEEVSDYIRQQGYNVDPDNFVDFYESKGWKVGKETMKDWKASVRTWHRRNKQSTTPSKVHNFSERSDTDWDALELKLLNK